MDGRDTILKMDQAFSRQYEQIDVRVSEEEFAEKVRQFLDESLREVTRLDGRDRQRPTANGMAATLSEAPTAAAMARVQGPADAERRGQAKPVVPAAAGGVH